MIKEEIPEGVNRIWSVFVKSQCQLLSAQQIADALEQKSNSVLQTIHRNQQYFAKANKKPILFLPEPYPEFILLRDNSTCVFCSQKFANSKLSIDTLDIPSQDLPLQLHNATVVCLECHKKRRATKLKHLPGKDYVQQVLTGLQKNQATTRIKFIRAIPNLSTDTTSSKKTVEYDAQSLQIFTELRTELSNLRETLGNFRKRKTVQYLEVVFTYNQDNWIRVSADKKRLPKLSSYWSWDRHPETKYNEEDENADWALGKDGTIVALSESVKPSEFSSLEVGLNFFGSYGYDLVLIESEKDEDYGSDYVERKAIFKRETLVDG